MLTMDEVAVRATGVSVADADRDDVLAVLDRQARKWLGVSGEQFLSTWRAGGYDGRDDAPLGRLLSTALLLG